MSTSLNTGVNRGIAVQAGICERLALDALAAVHVWAGSSQGYEFYLLHSRDPAIVWFMGHSGMFYKQMASLPEFTVNELSRRLATTLRLAQPSLTKPSPSQDAQPPLVSRQYHQTAVSLSDSKWQTADFPNDYPHAVPCDKVAQSTTRDDAPIVEEHLPSSFVAPEPTTNHRLDQQEHRQSGSCNASQPRRYGRPSWLDRPRQALRQFQRDLYDLTDWGVSPDSLPGSWNPGSPLERAGMAMVQPFGFFEAWSTATTGTYEDFEMDTNNSSSFLDYPDTSPARGSGTGACSGSMPPPPWRVPRSRPTANLGSWVLRCFQRANLPRGSVLHFFVPATHHHGRYCTYGARRDDSTLSPGIPLTTNLGDEVAATQSWV